MNRKFNVYIYICFILFPLLYYNYSFIYVYKGYASYIHICRGYVKHKRLRTTDLDYVASNGKKKGIAIHVTGHEGPEGCETSGLPHFLDNRIINGGEVVSPTRRPPFTP
jgi:hypothetical protein